MDAQGSVPNGKPCKVELSTGLLYQNSQTQVALRNFSTGSPH